MIPPRGAPRVLFAKPAPGYRAWPVVNDFCHHLFHTASAAYPALAAALGGQGVAFYDGSFERRATAAQLARLAARFPVVAMGVLAPGTALETEVQLRYLKHFAPRTKIVLGGHHPTFYATEWLRRGVDAVVRNEGEVTFPELLERLLAGVEPAGVAGVSWRRGGEAVTEPDRPFVKNLDDLPLPDWSVIDLGLYHLGTGPRGLSATVETARGCGHHCTFCIAAEMWRHRQRFKSIARLIAEFEQLHRLGVRQIMIADDNFGVHRSRDMQMFEYLRQQDFTFWAMVRADTIYHDPEWAVAATAAGLRIALIGYENLSKKVLETYRKESKGDLGYEEYRTVYRRLKAGGALVYGLFVRDYDFDEDDVWPARRIASVCDISAQSRYIPIHGVAGVERLVAKGYELKDMFYHNRFLPSYSHDGRLQKSRYFGAIIHDLLKLRNFYKMFFGSRVERTFFRRIYLSILNDLCRISTRHLKIAWLAVRRKTTPQQKQQEIVDFVLRKTAHDLEHAERDS